MIAGETLSADGLERRKDFRHARIVNGEIKDEIILFLDSALFEKSKEIEWVGVKDIFPSLEVFVNTPLENILSICKQRFYDNEKLFVSSCYKNIGILLREAAYFSRNYYYERFNGSSRVYKHII